MNGSIIKRMFLSVAACSLFAVSAFAQVATGPVLSSPANGSVGVAAPATFTWGTVDGATYYGVQVTTNSAFTGFTGFALNQTNLTTTSSTATTLAGTSLYYWRAGAGTASGSTNMTWSSVWTFTSAATAPSAPSLTAPSSNATEQPTSLTLSWSTAATALTYGVQVSLASDFATTVVSLGGLSATSAPVTGLVYSTNYYWHANAVNAVGPSAWSTSRRFTTQADPNFPSVPVLASPSNGATGQTQALTLSWNSSTNAATYGVQLSTDAAFASTIANAVGLTGVSYSVSGLAYNLVCYWHVNAKNSYGTCAWSSTRSFTVMANPDAPSVPTLASPANNAFNQATPVTLSWNSSTNATSYGVLLSNSSSFETTVIAQTGLTSLSVVAPGLAYSTMYYWKVNASNAITSSLWSTTRSFTTGAMTIAAPALASPSAGATGTLATVSLSWNSAANAATYVAVVSTSLNFTDTAFFLTDIPGTSTTLANLANNHTYFWKVRGVSGTTNGTWSGTWWFTVGVVGTLPARAAQPVTFSLANQAISYSVANAMPVSISVFNLLGRQVLSFDRMQPAGSYRFSLGRQGVTAGQYIVHFKAGSMDRHVAVRLFGRR